MPIHFSFVTRDRPIVIGRVYWFVGWFLIHSLRSLPYLKSKSIDFDNIRRRCSASVPNFNINFSEVNNVIKVQCQTDMMNTFQLKQLGRSLRYLHQTWQSDRSNVFRQSSKWRPGRFLRSLSVLFIFILSFVLPFTE